MGRDITGIGLAGARSTAPAWPVIEASLPECQEPVSQSLGAKLERKLVSWAVWPLQPAAAILAKAGSVYEGPVRDFRTKVRSYNHPVPGLLRAATEYARLLPLPAEQKTYSRFWKMWPAARAIRDMTKELSGPAIWVANDWQMLPIASAGAARTGGIAVYDSHELATEEYAERPAWVRFVRPIVASTEARFIATAKVISSVSPGITAHLKQLYDADAPHLTLRNAPAYERSEYRPSEGKVRVLYHGIVAPGRGLEASIESVAGWPAPFSLTIRGPSSLPGYTEALTALAAAKGVSERVTLSPPVAMTALVAEARPFDIGLMALPGHSLHNQFALPNKVFEYMMAGLALGVTDLPEMAALVSETKAGFLMGDGSPGAIAAAMNALNLEDLNAQRRNALDAARTYNWEAQSAPVIAAYERAYWESVG